MQKKDKSDGIEDSPLDMLLVILLEGASKEVVTPSSHAYNSWGEIMMIQRVAHHKKEVRKPTCASWLDISHPHQVK